MAHRGEWCFYTNGEVLLCSLGVCNEWSQEELVFTPPRPALLHGYRLLIAFNLKCND